MKTNELKKGTYIMLRNGWKARLEDNLKGNIRMATVWGYCTEEDFDDFEDDEYDDDFRDEDFDYDFEEDRYERYDGE